MCSGLFEDAATSTDGRIQRVDASARAILDAAVRVIVDDGVDALTHRAVAVTAGVPLAWVSYHYPKVEDLLVAAATQYLEEFDDRLRARAESARAGRRSMVEACTDFLFELVTVCGSELLAMVEVRLALHRRCRRVEGVGVVGVIESFGAAEGRAFVDRGGDVRVRGAGGSSTPRRSRGTASVASATGRRPKNRVTSDPREGVRRRRSSRWHPR